MADQEARRQAIEKASQQVRNGSAFIRPAPSSPRRAETLPRIGGRPRSLLRRNRRHDRSPYPDRFIRPAAAGRPRPQRGLFAP